MSQEDYFTKEKRNDENIHISVKPENHMCEKVGVMEV